MKPAVCLFCGEPAVIFCAMGPVDEAFPIMSGDAYCYECFMEYVTTGALDATEGQQE